MSHIKAGFAQYEVRFGEYDHNSTTVTRLIEENADADLMVLPELGLTGYEFKDREEVSSVAEPFGEGPTSKWLSDLAVRHAMTLVLGYPEYTTEGCFNSAMAALPDGSLHNYRKIHLFSREKELFLPGDAVPLVIDAPFGKLGIMICFDWIFPETAHSLAIRGAHVIAHPSNLVLNYCQQAMYCRCVENNVFAITANRTGTEDRAGRSLTFTGASQVLAPDGECLIQAPTDEEYADSVNVDIESAENKFVTPYNHRFDDRRPELYQGV